MIPRITLVTGLLLTVVAIALVLPWYPVTKSQMVPQIQTYTNLFEVPTESYQSVTVYTLPSPVTVQTANQGGQCEAAWTYCNIAAFFKSQNFSLQAGAIYTVSVVQCQECGLFIFEQSLGFTSFDILGSGTKSFTASSSGTYLVYIANLGNSPDTVSSISITGNIPENVEVVQTHIAYATTSVTQYSQTMLSPYTALGITTSITVLVLLAIMIVVAIILGQRSILTSASHKHRKRK